MSSDQRIAFANNLKNIMKMRHVEQSDIVSALNISASTVSDWVNGKKYPRVEAQQKLADFLGVSIVSLVSSFDFQRIKMLCTQKGISLVELAETIGVAPVSIMRLSQPGVIPNISILEKIAAVLGVSPGYLMGWTETTDHLHAALDPVFGPDTPAAQKLRELGRALAPAESELVDIYRGLNEKGQDMLLNTAVSYAANPELKKDGASSEETA